MPLYLTEADVAGLITPGAAPVVEQCFARMAAGEVENVPRRRLALDDGGFRGHGRGRKGRVRRLALRAAVPTVERVVAYCRTPERLQSFGAAVGAEAADSTAPAAATTRCWSPS